VLAYLRVHEFKTFVISGGSIEFIRACSSGVVRRGIPVLHEYSRRPGNVHLAMNRVALASICEATFRTPSSCCFCRVPIRAISRNSEQHHP